MELITKTDAIQTVHKALLQLMDTLPTKDMDGDRVFEDQEKAFLLFTANKMVCKALRRFPSWHTEDPEEIGEYLITWEVTRFGKTYRKLAIAEWEAPITNDEGDIVMESGAWILEDWLKDYDELSVVAWMPLPDAFEGEV